MKNSLTVPSLATENFNTLANETDEPVYTYNDEYMWYFVRKSIKSGRCTTLNKYYKSTISDEVFNFISTELNIRDKVCRVLEK